VLDLEKLILTVAPTGNLPTRALTPHVPLTPAEIAADIVACYREGAAICHIHARDNDEKPTHETEHFRSILAELDKYDCPIIRQISTGGRAGKTPEARAEALTLNPVSASLTTGSTNFPNMAYVNAPDLVDHLAGVMHERNIKPELEIFDAAMIANAMQLYKRGLLKEPLQFNLVMGIRGAIPATPKNLMFLVESLPANAVWSVSIIGPEHVPLSMIAMAMGGHVRVGVEDNIYYSKGVLATNVALVKRMAGIAKAMGRELATPDEARKILGIA
jgi:3-keto-5-aminohexanoate cleavage enzyme